MNFETNHNKIKQPDYMNLDRNSVITTIRDQIDTINSNNVKVISIVGGAGSGKTTFASYLADTLDNACTLSTDDYVIGDRQFRRNNLEGKEPILKYRPKALNDNIHAIKQLNDGESLLVPSYDNITGEGVDAKVYRKKIVKPEYIIVEGDFDFVENPDLLIYFDVDDETRLQNRITRDLEKGREINEKAVRESFALRQKLQHEPYTIPTKEKANLIIHANKNNELNSDKDPKDQYEYSIEVF